MRRQPGVLARGGHQDLDARVALRAPEHHRAHAGAGAQRGVHRAQAAQGLGEQHESEAAHGGVEAAAVEAERLTVGDAGLDLRQAGMPGVRSGAREDRRGDVGGQHLAACADAACDRERLPAGAGSDVEDAHAFADAGHAEHRLGGRPEPGVEQRRARVPAGSRGVPGRAERRSWPASEVMVGDPVGDLLAQAHAGRGRVAKVHAAVDARDLAFLVERVGRLVGARRVGDVLSKSKTTRVVP